MTEDDLDLPAHDFHYLHHRGQDDTQHHDTDIRDTQDDQQNDEYLHQLSNCWPKILSFFKNLKGF